MILDWFYTGFYLRRNMRFTLFACCLYNWNRFGFDLFVVNWEDGDFRSLLGLNFFPQGIEIDFLFLPILIQFGE